jgi:NAD(P)-dependent dehydrogenase (short-subunit alcohol dehydrogenase family)
MVLQGKVIVIVGGATGIGRATAELCFARGATAIIADVDATVGARTATELGATFYAVNVLDEASVQTLAAQLGKAHGRVDVLIQTAGVLRGAYVPLDEFTLETFRHVMEVNVTGTFLCVKHIAPLLKQSEHGVILLSSSGAATHGSSSYAYGASKGGVSALGVTLANTLAADGIRVNVVAPGNIDTAMKRSVIAADAQRRGADVEQLVSEAKLGSPAGVAKVLAWLASDDAAYVRGVITTR